MGNGTIRSAYTHDDGVLGAMKQSSSPSQYWEKWLVALSFCRI